MGTVEVIKKFIESNSVIERSVREVLERLPIGLRYGISYGPAFRHWLGFLRESERWDSDKLRAYQIEQLRDLLAHAGKRVPYYRKVFRDYGFDPERVQSFNDIMPLPYVTKETVRDAGSELISEDVTEQGLIRISTGGSTGIPVVIYGTKETEEKHWATTLDLWGRVGYHPKSRTVSFYHNITEGKKNFLPFKKYANHLILSRNFFGAAWLKRFLEMMRRFRPDFISGFPSQLSFFCALMEEMGEPPLEGIRAVLTYSEGETAVQRERIEKMFGARLFSSYGMAEKVVYGGACEKADALHLYPQYGFTEHVADTLGNSEIVSTGFINYAMPLIRYRTADIGEIHGFCEKCGRSYPLVPRLDGRAGDFLVDDSGNVISIVGVGTRSQCFRNVKMYQFQQEEKGKAFLKIVRGPAYSDGDTIDIRDELRKKLGICGNLDICLDFVNDIDRTPTGKERVIIQKLNMEESVKGRCI